MVHETTQAGYDCAVVSRYAGLSSLLGALSHIFLASCAGIAERNGAAAAAQASPGASGDTEAGNAAEREPPGALSRALSVSPADTLPVLSEGAPVAVSHDLNGDSREDVAMLTVRTASATKADSGAPFRPSTPPGEGATRYAYVLEYHLSSPRGDRVLDSLVLGSYSAARTFSVIRLHETEPLPASVEAIFYTFRGTEAVWTVFQEEGVPSTLRLTRTPNADFETFDIDGDGIREVIALQSRLEEGQGYETFLTLYELGPEGFSPADTINVVRNLRAYLDQLRQDILLGNWRKVTARGAEEVKDGEIDAELDRLFSPVEENGEAGAVSFSELAAGYGIDQVMLPQLLENPFGSLEQREIVTLPVNVVCCDGALFTFLLRVRLGRNPFEGEQFELVARKQSED